MQDQVTRPVYLSANQLADLFNTSIQDIGSEESNKPSNQDSQQEIAQEFSFQVLQISQSSIPQSIPKEHQAQNVTISREQYLQIMLKIEQNKILTEQYQKLLQENQDQIQIRKQLEMQNSEMLDANFKLKREIQETKQKLLIWQSAIPLRKDQQINDLRNQLKELQSKVSEKRDTQQSTTLTENSTVDSDKSNSYYCKTSRLVRVDQSSSHHQHKKPYRSRNNSLVKIVKN